MKWSSYYIPTLREAPQDAQIVSHKLMLRAGLVRMLMAGVYLYLPLGLKVLRKIENIIREEMNNAGSCEVLLSALQPIELWQKTGRDEVIGDVMIRFTDRRGRKISLGPTHEEIITFLAKQDIRSYRDLPVILYQIQTKFRDEIRPRFGLIRCCEFIMKDAYSFDATEEGLNISYSKMFNAYEKIFTRMGLKFYSIQADTGVMGGSESAEFLCPAECGEDKVMVCNSCGYKIGANDKDFQSCPECGNEKIEIIPAIEVGHIFKLGTKYSESLGLMFSDKDGKVKPVIMGCYGIGVSRLISAIIEQCHDERGIIWPESVSPFDVIIIETSPSDEIKKVSLEISSRLEKERMQVLVDDRDERAGVKFNDADLLGIPVQVVAGKLVKDGKVEIRIRKDGRSVELGINEIGKEKIKEIINGK